MWLSPAFGSWDLRPSLGAVACPVLAIQAADDPYGTAAQLDAIAAGVAGPCERLVVPGRTHSPHLDHPEVVVAAVARFLGACRTT